MLGDVAVNRGDWTDEQRAFAFDLLGVPHLVRDGSTLIPAPGDTAALVQLVEEQTARLRLDIKFCLHNLDQSYRGMAVEGMVFEEDAQTARLRRYEATHRRTLNWARTEFRRGREPKSTDQDDSAPSAEPPLSDTSSKYLVKRFERNNADRTAQFFEEHAAEIEAEQRGVAAPAEAEDSWAERDAEGPAEAEDSWAEHDAEGPVEAEDSWAESCAEGPDEIEIEDEGEAARTEEIELLGEDFDPFQNATAIDGLDDNEDFQAFQESLMADVRRRLTGEQAAARAWVASPAPLPPPPPPPPAPAPALAPKRLKLNRRERRAQAKAARQAAKGGGSPGSSR
jgi:hypothetical protein